MAVVAALFDSEADATAAMDQLMRSGLHDLDTHLVGSEERAKSDRANTILPIIPNTGGSTITQVAGAIPAGSSDWLGGMNDEERAFYLEGLKEGATLAIVKTDDADLNQVRTMMSIHGARTYTKK